MNKKYLIPFVIQKAADVVVYRNGVLITSDHYSVDTGLRYVTILDYAPADSIVISRSIVLDDEDINIFTNGSSVDSIKLNYIFDRLYNSIQDSIENDNARALKRGLNLSDLENYATARSNLGVYSKNEVNAALQNKLLSQNNLSDLTFDSIARYNLDIYSVHEVDELISLITTLSIPNFEDILIPSLNVSSRQYNDNEVIISKFGDGKVIVDGEILVLDSDISVSTSGLSDGINYIRLVKSGGSLTHNITTDSPILSEYGIYGYVSGESFSPCVSMVYISSGQITAFRDLHFGVPSQGNESLLIPGDSITILTSFDLSEYVEGNTVTIGTAIGDVVLKIPLGVITNSIEASISASFDGFGFINNTTTVTSDGITIDNLLESITISNGKQQKIGSGEFTIINSNYIINTSFKKVFSFDVYSGPDAGGWDDGVWL